MSNKQFIKYLIERNIPHKVAGKLVTVLGGYVDLRSLTTLPEGVKFENQGSVDLRSLTTLPEGVKFENQGSVYLRSLTALPEGVKFENQGSVYLDSLINKKQVYLGKERVFRQVDGFTMLISSTREQGDMMLSNAKYFGGGDIDKLKKCFIAQCGDFTAHGHTLKSAIEDVQFKLQEQDGKSEAIERIKSTEIVTANDFRIVTGACREGMRHHLAQRNIDMESIESLTLSDAIKVMSGSSFGDQFIHELEVPE